MRLQLALARHAGIGRAETAGDHDPRKLPLADLDYMVLIAIAAADQAPLPRLNQRQLKELLQERSAGSVSTSANQLQRMGLCTELTRDERLALGLQVDGRSKYYRVTEAGIGALLQYESVRFALPDAVAEAIHPLPEYRVVTQELSDSIARVLAEQFTEVQIGQ